VVGLVVCMGWTFTSIDLYGFFAIIAVCSASRLLSRCFYAFFAFVTSFLLSGPPLPPFSISLSMVCRCLFLRRCIPPVSIRQIHCTLFPSSCSFSLSLLLDFVIPSPFLCLHQRRYSRPCFSSLSSRCLFIFFIFSGALSFCVVFVISTFLAFFVPIHVVDIAVLVSHLMRGCLRQCLRRCTSSSPISCLRCWLCRCCQRYN
jgi:hypothetical protein